MNIIPISLLFLYWFTIWGIFNFLLLPNNISHLNGGRKVSAYFIFASVVPYLILDTKFLFLLAIQLIILLPFGVRHQAIKNLFANIIFQQLMLYVLFDLSAISNQILYYLIFIAGITISHLPLVLLKHVHLKGKMLIHLCLPVASSIIFFTYFYFSPIMAIIIGIIIHFSFYLSLYRSKLNAHLGIIV